MLAGLGVGDRGDAKDFKSVDDGKAHTNGYQKSVEEENQLMQDDLDDILRSIQ